MSFTGDYDVGALDVYMLNSVGDRTSHCGTPVLNWRCVNILFLVMFLCCSLCVYVDRVKCFATVIVRSGGLFWLNPVAMVLFMLCPKRHSMHEDGLVQTYAHIVSMSSLFPEIGADSFESSSS